MTLFDYEGRKIGFEVNPDSLKLFVGSSQDLDLALYCVEVYSGVANKGVEVEKVCSLNGSTHYERFRPVESHVKKVPVYTAFNYVLFNSELKHDFLKVVERYVKFFFNLEDRRTRKIQFLDFDYEILSTLPRIPGFDSRKPKAFPVLYNDGEIGQRVETIMFQTPNFTQALRKLFGFDSRYRLETRLEDRIILN